MGSNGNEFKICDELLSMLTHCHVSKIIQSVFGCKHCFKYFYLLMNFLIEVSRNSCFDDIFSHCMEDQLKNKYEYKSEKSICKSFFFLRRLI